MPSKFSFLMSTLLANMRYGSGCSCCGWAWTRNRQTGKKKPREQKESLVRKRKIFTLTESSTLNWHDGLGHGDMKYSRAWWHPRRFKSGIISGDYSIDIRFLTTGQSDYDVKSSPPKTRGPGNKWKPCVGWGLFSFASKLLRIWSLIWSICRRLHVFSSKTSF